MKKINTQQIRNQAEQVIMNTVSKKRVCNFSSSSELVSWNRKPLKFKMEVRQAALNNGLTRAVESNNAQMIKDMLQGGADANYAHQITGLKILDLALSSGASSKIIELLQSYGATKA